MYLLTVNCRPKFEYTRKHGQYMYTPSWKYTEWIVFLGNGQKLPISAIFKYLLATRGPKLNKRGPHQMLYHFWIVTEYVFTSSHQVWRELIDYSPKKTTRNPERGHDRNSRQYTLQIKYAPVIQWTIAINFEFETIYTLKGSCNVWIKTKQNETEDSEIFLLEN